MSVSSTTLVAWTSDVPRFGGTCDKDHASLAAYVKEGERLLATLPEKNARDGEQGRIASCIREAIGQAKSRFLDHHAEAVYNAITAGKSGRIELSELALETARRFPHLLPSADLMAKERDRTLADREGFEIDQGIFFRGLLRSAAAGSRLLDAMLAPTRHSLEKIAQFRRCDVVELESVTIERLGATAYLTINNQASLNAEDDRLVDDLETAIDLTLLDDRVRVGVLRGGLMNHPRYEGRRVFSAGINLRELFAGRISFVDFILRRELGLISKIAHGLWTDSTRAFSLSEAIQKPWVAAVDSFAIGGGMQMLLVFDHIIAADDAFFALPAAQEGIVPGAANLRLNRMTNGRLSRQLLLAGKRIQASDPEARWLCDEVVPSAGMEEAIQRAATELGSPAVVENRRMLSLAEEPRDRFREYMAEFAYVQAKRMYSNDVLAKISHWRSPK